MTAWQLSPVAGAGREIVHRIVGPFLGLLVGGPRVEGTEWLTDLPRPLLICPNHESHLDIPVLRRSLGGKGRRRLAIAAADDYWFQRRAYRLLVSWFAAVPFRRIGRGVESIHAVEGLLADGWRVVIFPEGTRSRTGEIAHVQGGRRARRGARPRPRPARADRRAVGGVAARGTAAASPRSQRALRPTAGGRGR